MQPALDHVGIGLEPAGRYRPQPVRRKAVPRRVAAVAWIDIPEAGNPPVVDRALRHLIGRIPAIAIGHGADADAFTATERQRVAQHAIELAHALRHDPWPILLQPFQPIQCDARPHLVRIGQYRAAIIVLPQLDLRDAGRQFGDVVHADRARCREIALLGKVGALLVCDAADQFRDHEIEVGIALAMGVRAHIHRHAGHTGGKIGAVVQVEAAQEILVCLAVAAVLGDDQPRHGFKQFAGAQQRTVG